MNAVENQVRELVKVELAAANEKFPPFHSAHEGWAVMLEEIKELQQEVQSISLSNEAVFDYIMKNSNHLADTFVRHIKMYAAKAACEAIQVAAMCQKFLDMEDKQ